MGVLAALQASLLGGFASREDRREVRWTGEHPAGPSRTGPGLAEGLTHSATSPASWLAARPPWPSLVRLLWPWPLPKLHPLLTVLLYPPPVPRLPPTPPTGSTPPWGHRVTSF